MVVVGVIVKHRGRVEMHVARDAGWSDSSKFLLKRFPPRNFLSSPSLIHHHTLPKALRMCTSDMAAVSQSPCS